MLLIPLMLPQGREESVTPIQHFAAVSSLEAGIRKSNSSISAPRMKPLAPTRSIKEMRLMRSVNEVGIKKSSSQATTQAAEKGRGSGGGRDMNRYPLMMNDACCTPPSESNPARRPVHCCARFGTTELLTIIGDALTFD